jgi:tetratricopeptide (TPR) repeat protein/TolB-like protein
MPKDLWPKLRKGRVFQVLLLYLGASWGVLEVAELLQNSLALPAWIAPAAFLLLLIGLMVILATAMVQSHPYTEARQKAGEVPGAWELAPKELGEGLKRGRLPHPTWSRAIIGGVFAFSLLFGLAGAYVVIQDRGESFAPVEAVADEAGEGLAVVPFTVNREDLEVWREGMVDILSTTLDDIGGYRTIDSRTVMARWREAVPGVEVPDLQTTLEVARRAGARYLLTGSAVGTGTDVRLVAEIYKVGTGGEFGRAQVQGPAENMLDLVDELSVAIMQELLEEGGSGPMPGGRVAALTTSSLPALKEYLEGEALYRKAEFAAAVEPLERALEHDPDFALAHYRLGDAYGWVETIGSERGSEHLQRAAELAEDLRPRDRTMVRSAAGLVSGDLTPLEDLKAASRRYPDDPEIWYGLGEFYYHYSGNLMVPFDELVVPLQRAVDLDPTFAPYYIHLIEHAVVTGDSAGAAALMDRYEPVSSPEWFTGFSLALPLFLGDSVGQAAARAALDTLNGETLRHMALGFSPARPVATEPIIRELSRRDLFPGGRLPWVLLQAGKADEAAEVFAASEGPLAYHASLYAIDRWLKPVEPGLLEATLVPGACGDAEDASWDCLILVGAYLVEAGELADLGVHLTTIRQAEAAARAEEDGYAGGHIGFIADAIEAYVLASTADTQSAIRTLERLQGSGYRADRWVRLWLAELLAESGRPNQAARYFESLADTNWWTYALYRLGDLYLELGEEGKARNAYIAFLQAWEEADPDLPQLTEVREALRTLRGG